ARVCVRDMLWLLDGVLAPRGTAQRQRAGPLWTSARLLRRLPRDAWARSRLVHGDLIADAGEAVGEACPNVAHRARKPRPLPDLVAVDVVDVDRLDLQPFAER